MTKKIIDRYNFDMRLFKRLHHDTYYVEIRRGKCISLRTKDLEEAKRRLKKLQKDIVGEKLSFVGESVSMSVSAYFEEYERWAAKNQSYTTYQRLKRILKKFLLVIDARAQIGDLTAKDMDNFILYCRQRNNVPATINIEIRHIKAVMSKAVQWKYLRENPFKYVKQLKYQQLPPRYLTKEQIQKVFSVIKNDQYFLVFALYVYTGARRAEIHNLDWRDIKKDEIFIRRSKNYKSRVIPITDALNRILEKYRRDIGPLFNMSLDQMGRRMKWYLRKAGVGHIRPHDLRHTFASHLVMSGTPLTTVRDLLGHGSIQTTLIYSHLDKEALKKGIGNLPY